MADKQIQLAADERFVLSAGLAMREVERLRDLYASLKADFDKLADQAKKLAEENEALKANLPSDPEAESAEASG